MEINSVNPKLRQDQIAKKLGCSNCTLQRYRNDINMPSPYRIQPNSNKKKQKISTREHDIERHQMTSNDRKRPQLTSKKVTEENVISLQTKSNYTLKSGFVQKNFEINSECLDEILQNNNL